MHKSLVSLCDYIFTDVSVRKNLEYFRTSIIHDSVSINQNLWDAKNSRIPWVVWNRWWVRFHRSLRICDWDFIFSHVQSHSSILPPYCTYGKTEMFEELLRSIRFQDLKFKMSKCEMWLFFYLRLCINFEASLQWCRSSTRWQHYIVLVEGERLSRL